MARRGPLYIVTAGLSCFTKAWEWTNQRLGGLVLASFLQWKREGSIGQNVVLVMDKEKVVISLQQRVLRKGQFAIWCCVHLVFRERFSRAALYESFSELLLHVKCWQWLLLQLL